MNKITKRPIQAKVNYIRKLACLQPELYKEDDKRIFYCKTTSRKNGRIIYTLFDNRNARKRAYYYDTFEEMINDFYNREYEEEK